MKHPLVFQSDFGYVDGAVSAMYGVAYGVDPIHFGVILVCCCGVGFSTPPMGENMFIASGIADQSLEAISAKALPFVAVNLSAIALMVAFPQIVLWLPNLLSAVE